MTVNRPAYPPDHYMALYLAQLSDDEAAGFIAGRPYHVDAAPGCNCPHCQMANEHVRLTRVEPHAVTARHVVTWHVNNADNPDPRFRGDVDWARRFLAEWVTTGWLTEAEANEIRRAVGWDVTAVQLELPMT